MYTGLYSFGMINPPGPPHTCPTGNCTWAPFPTLAFSTKCVDISSKYHLNCSDAPSSTNDSVAACVLRPVQENVADSWGPSKYTVFTGIANQNRGGSASELPPDLRSGFGLPETNSSSLNFGYASFIWSLAKNLTFDATVDRSVVTETSTFEAGHCVFYMSMQIIQPTVVNGTYSENILSSSTEIKDYQQDGKGAILEFVDKEYCDTHGSCGLGDSQHVAPKLTGRSYQRLMGGLTSVFPSGNFSTFRRDGLVAGSPAVSESYPAAASLYRSPDITKTMHSIINYMNVALRANDTVLAQQNDPQNLTGIPDDFVAPSHRVAGTVYVQAVHLHVRWAWLTLPAVLLVLVAVILFETIRSSQSQAVGVWKDNPLAVLMNTEWRPDPRLMGGETSNQISQMTQRLEASIVVGSKDDFGAINRRIIIREKA